MTSPLLDAFSKPFEPAQIEERLRRHWDTHNFFHATRDESKKPYTIVIPPPNVTGDLHMGHVLNNSLQDILIRWQRAMGRVACWIPGTDHASIATEAKVTKMLAEKGIDKKIIGREEFLKHAWAWKEEYSGRIVGLLKLLGCSCDWQRENFTMGTEYSASVIKAFVTLYKEGLVYRGKRLVNWCPVSQSVISEEEVIHEERNGSLWHIRYPIEGSTDFLVVATTRPETLLGDLAIAVHPEDERYKHHIGKHVVVPICNRRVPIIGDAYVEKEFGTGVLKITPAHDLNDFEVGKRHNLGLLNVMNPDATLNNEAPPEYRGLDRFVARKKIVAELEKIGLLEKIQPHKLAVGISERGQVPIEFFLSEQWYIKMKPLAEKALDATRSKRLKLKPEFTEKIWEHWLTGIQDWCVSRQLWWGHQIPIYTCTNCKHEMCEEQPPTECDKCHHKTLKQDPDVLDTWASSWLWPFGVHNWANPSAEQKKDLDYFYPTECIVTGLDIIFFWIARMVMAGEHFTQKTPFNQVYFTPIVRDAKGRKMSKSLGNVPDTIGLMKKYGTDALRFAVVNQSVPGQDISWADESCEIGRTFANKIWNVTRFLLMNCEKFGVEPSPHTFEKLPQSSTDPLQGWMASEFFDAVRKSHDAVTNLDFGRYTSAMYEFTWMIYCDWFIELIKPKFADGANPTEAKQALGFALSLFDGVLRMLHPVMPFLTDEIWQGLSSARTAKTIGFETLPVPDVARIDEQAIRTMREIQQVVGQVRTIRGQFTIHPTVELQVSTNAPQSQFGKLVPQMEFLAKAKFNFGATKPKLAATGIVSGYEYNVNLDGLVDASAERDRLKKKIEKLQLAIASTEKRLSNAEFVASAPQHIVAGARAQLEANQSELASLASSLAELK